MRRIKHLALFMAILVGQTRLWAQTIDFDLPAAGTATVKVTFYNSDPAPAIELWLMTPTPSFQCVFSTCNFPVKLYPTEVSCTAGTVSKKDVSAPNTKPAHFSISCLTYSDCNGGGLRTPAITAAYDDGTPLTSKYFVNMGSTQATVEIQYTSAIGKKGNTATTKRKGGCCCGNTSDASDVRQPVPIPRSENFYPQERSNWCWAATGQTIMQKVASELNLQCTHARRVLGAADPAGLLVHKKPVTVDCDAPSLNRGIEDFASDLAAFGFMADRGSGVPDKNAAWIIEWTTGGRHAMVLDHTEADYIYGFDPWPVNEGSYFIMRTDDRNNEEFITREFYTSIRKS